MLNITSIPARDLQKSYKSIIQAVKNKKTPVILTTQNVPQAAIVSLDDLEKLKDLKGKNSAKVLLEIAKKARELDIKGPRDLAENHDFYLWGRKRKQNA